MKSRWVLAVIMTGWLAGCGKKQDQAPGAGGTNAGVGNPLTAPADYVGAIGQAKRVSEKVVDTASVKRAVQTFHASEDRYPQDLNELVKSGYMPALPQPPAGMKFQYDRATGEVRLVRAQ